MLVEINQQSNYYQGMSYSFEYIDIILLAMIAGFIFLRLRGILGKRSGYEDDISNSFPHEMPEMKSAAKPNYRNFDESAKKDFLPVSALSFKMSRKSSWAPIVFLGTDWSRS